MNAVEGLHIWTMQQGRGRTWWYANQEWYPVSQTVDQLGPIVAKVVVKNKNGLHFWETM